MPIAPPPDPAGRDRAVRAVRLVSWVTGLGVAGLTAGLAVAAAHAFKGHDGTARVTRPALSTRHRAHLRVPGPQDVPAIAGAPAPLQPPPQPPAAVAPTEQVPQETSGGS
jgi:hypothetical protein